MRRFACLLGALAFASCTDGPGSCGDAPKSYPAIGSGTVSSGDLATDAVDQRIVVSPDRQFLEYTFKRNGTTMTARYALSETPRSLALTFVTIGRPPPAIACNALAGRGPVIDSIEVKRGGVVISDPRAFFASGRCGDALTAKATDDLNGPPDGNGVALAGGGLGWAVGERIALVSGDEVTVTVLDGSGEPFEVFASWQETSYDVSLGRLTGTGTLIVP
jgi:hypothetical protein